MRVDGLRPQRTPASPGPDRMCLRHDPGVHGGRIRLGFQSEKINIGVDGKGQQTASEFLVVKMVEAVFGDCEDFLPSMSASATHHQPKKDRRGMQVPALLEQAAGIRG